MRSRMIAYIFGISIYWALPDASQSIWPWSILAIIFIFTLLFQPIKVLIWLFALGMIASFLQYQFYKNYIRQMPSHHTTQTVVVKVEQIKQYSTSIQYQVILEPEARHINALTQWMASLWPIRYQLTWYLHKSFNKTSSRLYDSDKTQKFPQVGEIWQLPVRLKRIHGYNNPVGFDYDRYAFSKGLMGKGYIRTKDTLVFLQENHSLMVSLVKRLQILLQQSTFKNKGLIFALITANKSLLNKDTINSLQQSGLAHLLAISGLHIGMMAWVGFILGRLIWFFLGSFKQQITRQDFCWFCALLICSFYASLSQWSLPTLRAMLMLTIYCLAQWLRLRWTLLDVLLLSGSILMTVNPLLVIDTSTWLSFGAVLVISLLINFKFDRGDKAERVFALRNKFYQWIGMAFGLWVAMIPLSMMLFSQINSLGMIANLIAIPIMTFIVMPSLVLGFVGLFISHSLALWLLTPADWSLSLILEMAKYLSQWSLHIVPNYITLILLTMACIGLLLPQPLFSKKMALTLAIGALFYQLIPHKSDQSVNLTIFDVGQGLSVLWQQGEHNVLYDTASGDENFQVIQQTVTPYLQQQGIDKLDLLIVSHSDNDHAGGLRTIEELFPKTVLLSGQPLNSKLTQKSCHPVKNKYPSNSETINQKKVGNTQKVGLSQFHFLTLAVNLQEDNNFSCVLEINYKSHRILLTGDIEKEREILLATTEQLYPVDVLIAPHHGSKTSSSDNLVDKTQPKNVIFSSGYLNRFGFPHPKVVARYKKVQSKIFNTATDGAIQCHWNQNGVFEGCSKQSSSRWARWHL